MNAELFAAVEMLVKTKGISSDYLYEKIETALQSAYKKDTNAQNVRVAINPDKKEIKIFKQMTVVETVEDEVTEISLEDAKKINRRYDIGSVAEIEIKPTNFRRLSARSGTQILIQAIREAEHNTQLREYESKREEIMTAVVTRVNTDDGAVMVDTGTSEILLRRDDQIPGESFSVGDRIKVYVTEVHHDEPKPDSTRSRAPIVTLSRTHSGLVKRLFETEIPEIAEGIVLVKGVAREAGSRTKIAVYTRDEDVDAVGACIGNRGMRIGSIIDELRGEKIDVIEFSEDPAQYIASALAPADVIDVTIEGERNAKVIVAADQLSLAIGKEGQNARLAARLTGYKIDIKA